MQTRESKAVFTLGDYDAAFCVRFPSTPMLFGRWYHFRPLGVTIELPACVLHWDSWQTAAKL